MQPERTALDDHERAVYEWQMWVPGFGEEGQERLRASSILISRVGGLGSVVAYELAAAGIGKLVLAHAGTIEPGDLNRQLLATHAGLGTPRIETIGRRLLELNPRLELELVPENVSEGNADALVARADLVVDCAPRFEERFALNSAIVRQRKPMIECAMYELQCQITTIIPFETPCLACVYPEIPAAWKRKFPVFGAVSGSVGCMAAMEAIKVLTGLGAPLAGRLLTYDLRDVTFRTLELKRREACAVCGGELVDGDS